MNETYVQIIKYIVHAGKVLLTRAGKVKDIGVTKKYLTEEDFRIERGLKKIIKKANPNHELFAEEEHNIFLDTEDVWIADPISGTRTFIDGLPAYAVVISHLNKGKTQFAAVYDPTMNELFTAYRNKGSYLNGRKLRMKQSLLKKPKIVFSLSIGWKEEIPARKMFYELSKFELYRTRNSFAINDCHVACGKYDGSVILAKDSFPYFASSLIIKEAGGIFTNLAGEENIKPDDRVFISGNKEIYKKLKAIADRIIIL